MTEIIYIRDKFLTEDENIKSVVNSQQKYIDNKINGFTENVNNVVEGFQQTAHNLSTQLGDLKTDMEPINHHDFEGEHILRVGEPLELTDAMTKQYVDEKIEAI